MSGLSRYGISLSPNDPISFMLKGWLNAWSYDASNPLNSIRDRSVQIQNICDEALAQYMVQLRGQLSLLRRHLEQPTHENPNPIQDGLEAVQDFDRYIHRVEALRTKIRSFSPPPKDMMWRGKAGNLLLFQQLEQIDRDLLLQLSEMNEEQIHAIEETLAKRNFIMQQFFLRE